MRNYLAYQPYTKNTIYAFFIELNPNNSAFFLNFTTTLQTFEK